MQQRQLIVYIAASLDGYIAKADGDLGWLSAVEAPPEDYGYAAFTQTVDTVIMGRKTYDVALGFPDWPYAGKRCIVLTHRESLAQHGEEFWHGPPAEIAARLAQQAVRRVYVDGGEVIRQFLAARLIDDLTISIIPVVLGAGIPLFAADASEQPLTLLETRSFASGLVQLRYRAASRST
jgi:dihydrofolate reductase